MDKYEELVIENFDSKSSVAVNVLGGVGLLNSVIAFWIWFFFDLNTFENTFYWWTMLAVMCTTGFLWIPIFIVWPVYTFGKNYMTRVVNVLAQITMIGVYGAYWINLGAMIYTLIVDLDASNSRLSKAAGMNYTISYGVLVALDTAMSIIFVPSIAAWYKEEQKLRKDLEDKK